MDTIKRFLREILSPFFTVNPFAGKLRAIIFLLLVFIFWTLNAQSRSLPIDGFLNIPAQEGFIRTIMVEITYRYFHPLTLTQTFIPVVLFFITRNHAGQFLNQIINGKMKSIISYFNHCAFSSKRNFLNKTICSHPPQKNFSGLNEQLFSPSAIDLAPSDILITQCTTHPYLYKAIINKDPSQTVRFYLEHQTKIVAIIHADSTKIAFQSPGIIDPLQLLIRLSYPIQQIKNNSIVSFEITKNDAHFLFETKNQNEVLIPFVQMEIRNYFHTWKKVHTQSQSTPAHNLEKDVNKEKRYHNNYAKHSINFLPVQPWFTRPRKHLIYGEIFTSNKNDGYLPENIRDQQKEFIYGLENHIQKELVSFFDLNIIHITLNKD